MAGALDLQLGRATALAAAARIRLTEPFLRALRRLIVAASAGDGRAITERDLRRLIAALTAVANTTSAPLAPRIRVERAAAQAGGLWPAALLTMRAGERRAVHPRRPPKTARPATKTPAGSRSAAAARKARAAKDGKTGSRSRGAAAAAPPRAGRRPASGRREAPPAAPARSAYARLEDPTEGVAAKEFEPEP